MNEKIRELLKQAEERYPRHLAVAVSEVVLRQDALEKFAELIVRECIDKIETYRIPVGNSASGELACEWTYNALKEIRDEIKEHFGVK